MSFLRSWLDPFYALRSIGESLRRALRQFPSWTSLLALTLLLAWDILFLLLATGCLNPIAPCGLANFVPAPAPPEADWAPAAFLLRRLTWGLLTLGAVELALSLWLGYFRPLGRVFTSLLGSMIISAAVIEFVFVGSAFSSTNADIASGVYANMVRTALAAFLAVSGGLYLILFRIKGREGASP